MSTPGFPDIPYVVGSTTTPMGDSLRVRIAPNGQSHVQAISVYDSCQRDLNHLAIERTQMDELLAFWDTNRNAEFTWIDEAGLSWLGRFRSRPTYTHVGGTRWTCVSRLVLRRLDQ